MSQKSEFYKAAPLVMDYESAGAGESHKTQVGSSLCNCSKVTMVAAIIAVIIHFALDYGSPAAFTAQNELSVGILVISLTGTLLGFVAWIMGKRPGFLFGGIQLVILLFVPAGISLR